MKVSSKDYDAVIVGGGPAGSSAAIHLASGGARVLLAEQKTFPRAKLCGEFISPECLDYFDRLGISEQTISRGGVRLTETVFYARNGKSVSIPSEWFGAGKPSALGLSRAEMDSRLLARARSVGVEVHESARATDLLMEEGKVVGVSLKINEGYVEPVRARITIDATGRTRALSRRVQNGNRNKSLTEKKHARLVAFKAHLEGTTGTSGHCEIYVYKGGYGGLNSVENGLSNLCFITSARDARAFGSDPNRLMREVVGMNNRAARTLRDARNATPWIAVALDGFGRQSVAPASGLLTVGDAASFIDPFTGSGMLMALESGELAASAVGRYLPQIRQGGEFGGLADEYRKRYNEKFSARLRVCAGLRRAAFVPRFAEALIFLLSGSERVRRRLARATHSTCQSAGGTPSLRQKSASSASAVELAVPVRAGRPRPNRRA